MNETQVVPTSTPAPVTSTPAPQTPPATTSTPAPAGQDAVALAKRVGELEQVAKEYEDYRQKADPVLETLWTDQELLAQATAAHNKRLGIKTETPAPKTPPAQFGGDSDTRMAMVLKTQSDFESKAGIDKLSPEDQQKVRGEVGYMIKEMLDPMGNKTMAQIWEEVSLVKLPWYLDKAHKLISRDRDLKSAQEQGKNEILSQYEGERGMVGSMPGGSVSADSVTLTPQERKVAAMQGISEEDYLKSKKEILASR